MQFSALDPVDLARAEAALETAWRAVKPSIPDASVHAERERLAQVVADLAAIAEDEDDLALRALRRYRHPSYGRAEGPARMRGG